MMGRLSSRAHLHGHQRESTVTVVEGLERLALTQARRSPHAEGLRVGNNSPGVGIQRLQDEPAMRPEHVMFCQTIQQHKFRTLECLTCPRPASTGTDGLTTPENIETIPRTHPNQSTWQWGSRVSENPSRLLTKGAGLRTRTDTFIHAYMRDIATPVDRDLHNSANSQKITI